MHNCTTCANSALCKVRSDSGCENYVAAEYDTFLWTMLSIREEYRKAVVKHPEFPESNTNAQSVIMEEMLEAITAFNDGDMDNYEMELKHLGVTIVRELQRLEAVRMEKRLAGGE